MLRLLALLLLVGNALLLAAQFGLFDRLTGANNGQPPQREPERLQRQVNPEGVRILSPQAASAALGAAAASAALTAAAASSAAALSCLEAGPFGGTDADTAERTLRDAGLAPGSWLVLKTEDAGAFMVYMGRYADHDALQRKLDEVKRMKLPVEELRGAPPLQPGLSLGRFDHKADADAALARMVQRGVRSARVITLRQAQSQTLLRVPTADAAARARLAGLRLPSGPGFVACSAEAAPTPAGSASAPAEIPAATARFAPAAAAAAGPQPGVASASPMARTKPVRAAPAAAATSGTPPKPAAVKPGTVASGAVAPVAVAPAAVAPAAVAPGAAAPGAVAPAAVAPAAVAPGAVAPGAAAPGAPPPGPSAAGGPASAAR